MATSKKPSKKTAKKAVAKKAPKQAEDLTEVTWKMTPAEIASFKEIIESVATRGMAGFEMGIAVAKAMVSSEGQTKQEKKEIEDSIAELKIKAEAQVAVAAKILAGLPKS